MASDSKLIKWVGSVIKFIDRFSIEPESECFESSQHSKSKPEDAPRSDGPLQCSTPIPRTANGLHSGMMDHIGMDEKDSTSLRRNFTMMKKDKECCNAPISRTASFLQSRITDYYQVSDKHSALPKRAFTVMQEDSECCSTKFQRTADCLHPGRVDRNEMGDNNSTLYQATFNLQEYSESCSTPLPRTAFFSHLGMIDNNEMGTKNPSVSEFFRMQKNQCCSTPISGNPLCSQSGNIDNEIDGDACTAQQNLKYYSTLIARNAYFPHQRYMGQNQMDIENSASHKTPFTMRENPTCSKERNFAPGKGNLIGYIMNWYTFLKRQQIDEARYRLLHLINAKSPK